MTPAGPGRRRSANVRRCVMCMKDQEQVSLIQVVPMTWTGFNNYVEVCAACRASEPYQKLVKQKKIVKRAA